MGMDAWEIKLNNLRPDSNYDRYKDAFYGWIRIRRDRYTRNLPSTKIIIFSGSDDLEYAQKAIKNKCSRNMY